MFTGLVQAVGHVERIQPRPTGCELLIAPTRPPPSPQWPLGWPHRPSLGDSLCVSGCCLTLARLDGPFWAFDVVHETLSKTTLGAFTPGRAVNLEHSVTPSTLMGGHFVQGHVDGVGRVSRVQAGDDWRLRVDLPASLLLYMTPKGSVCVDGVSLTIAAVERLAHPIPPAAQPPAGLAAEPAAGWIELALIPATLERTTLSELREGDGVNIEADVLAKTVVNVIRNFQWALPR